MPRGRQRSNPVPEPTPEEQVQRDMTPPVEPELEGAVTEQAVTDGGTQETASEEQAAHEPASAGEPEQAATDGTRQETAPAPAGPELNEEPLTLAGYLADSVREFMRDFGINGHSPESVYASIMERADQFRGDQPVQSEQQERTQSPMEPAIPLNVRINSLEMDGDTRAFATVEYGDLTIRRIRVKQDDYGAMSVAMPKFRQVTGWSETCFFNTAEARNRLTGAVLDAYGQTLAQMQGQTQTAAEAQDPEQVMEQEPEDGPGIEESEQGGPVMGMSQW